MSSISIVLTSTSKFRFASLMSSFSKGAALANRFSASHCSTSAALLLPAPVDERSKTCIELISSPSSPLRSSCFSTAAHAVSPISSLPLGSRH